MLPQENENPSDLTTPEMIREEGYDLRRKKVAEKPVVVLVAERANLFLEITGVLASP